MAGAFDVPDRERRQDRTSRFGGFRHRWVGITVIDRADIRTSSVRDDVALGDLPHGE
jgi:hypothetical protein